MKMSKFIGVLTVLAGIAIAIGPWTFVKVCGDMGSVEAVCHQTRLMAMGFGLVILLLGIIMMLVRHKILAGLFSLVIAAAGVATILLPILIAPVCDMNTMSCHEKTLPFLLVTGCLLTVIGLLSMVYMFKSRKPKEVPAEVSPHPVRPEQPAQQPQQAPLEQTDWTGQQ
ncbi:MAG: DUF4418 family protein [Firmicutes bacterium]|nr:DUF4418 family protein [Bacillota bacterium]